MQLIPNAFETLTKAWSPRLMALAALAEGLIQLYPEALVGMPEWVVIGLIVAALGSRFIAQKGLSIPAEQDKADG